MTPDEVRMLDNGYALLFIRGERPVMDLKYDILKHPDVRLTTDGQADAYIHGEPWDAGSSIELDFFNDGFSLPIYAVNKRTGEEILNYPAGFTEDNSGFEDLDFRELEYQSFERKYRIAGELIKPKEAYKVNKVTGDITESSFQELEYSDVPEPLSPMMRAT